MNRKQPHRGKVPYGYQRCSQNEIVPHTDESKVLTLLFELFIQHRRKGTVARLLNEQDFRTRTNSNWSDMAVGRILVDSNYNQILKSSSSEDDKVIVIALDCGFRDLTYFNRKFRQLLGCPPTAYRGRLRGRQ